MVEYPLAEFSVDENNLYVKKLHYGTGVATSSFWTEGSQISHWQIGQYLAAVTPINSTQIPRCASLVVKVGEGVTVNIITVVTQKPEPCNQPFLCIYTPREYLQKAPVRNSQVFVNRFPKVIRVSGVDFLRDKSLSRKTTDIYDTFAVSLQLSVALVSSHSMRNSFYDSSIMMYSSYAGNLPDYTISNILQGYLNSDPMSVTHKFFGDLLVTVVNNGKFACR